MQELDQLISRYLAHHRALGHSAKTVGHYQDSFTVFGQFLTATNRPATAEALTSATFDAFATWLRETPTRGWRGRTTRSAHSIHGHLKDLRAFVRYLADEGLLDRAPRLALPKLPQTLFPALTDEQLATIFQTEQLDPRTEIGTRNRALIAFMLDTGVRRAEAAGLALDRLDLRDGSARILGKGNKERVVFFSPATAEALRRWLAIRGDDPGAVFWLAGPGIRALFDRLRHETGIEQLHAHTLRHTNITMLIRQGVDLHTIRRLAGHSSIAITEAYAALSTDELRAKHAIASPFARIQEQLAPTPLRARRRLKSA